MLLLLIQDNFAHDLIRRDTKTGQILQGLVLADPDLNFTEAYRPVDEALDPLLSKYLEFAETAPLSPTTRVKQALSVISSYLLPFTPDLSLPEFIPTMQLAFIQKLAEKFPNHRLILSDFDSLPDSINQSWIHAPVVQTRYQGTTVPCSTYMTHPGWFDIFFPTDFNALAWTFYKVTGRQGYYCKQKEFLKEWAGKEGLAKTRTRFGENVMLEYYRNFKFFVVE